MPRVSVVITTYNGEDVIKDTVDSILQQTFQDFEIIIVDDCSKDNTVDVIQSIQDDRIRLFVNESNQGSFFGLQKGLELATGDFIARTDQDDISYPKRFERQICFMEKHPDVLLCGTRHEKYFSKTRRRRSIDSGIISPRALAFSLLFGDYAFIHSSFFFRKQEVIDKGIKYEKFPYAEDYHFLMQAIARSKIGKVDEVLVGYRIHPGQFTNWEPEEDKYREDDEIIASYAREAGITEEVYQLAQRINRGTLTTEQDFDKMKALILQRSREYELDHETEKRAITHVYTMSVIKQRIRNMMSLRKLIHSDLVNWRTLFTPIGIIYMIKCIF